MARPNRFQVMELFRHDIAEAIHNLEKKVLSVEEILGVLIENERNWRLPKSTTVDEFIEFLISKKIIIREYAINFGTRITYRFLLSNDVSEYEIALSLYKNAYLSHYSAAFHHQLTDNIVKTIFVNKELSPKSFSSERDLEQPDIDKAFSKPARLARVKAKFEGYNIQVLNSKFTDSLGIVSLGNLRVTNIERTLIDIAVRPIYCGGVFEVLNVYKNANGRASINKLSAMLKKLDYIYPYHQTIGFYLERAGYKENVLRLIERFPMKYDFYLTNEIKKKKYSERWKIFYPDGI